jgi:hypothetical protein
MLYDDWLKTAKIFATKNLIDELMTLRNRSKSRFDMAMNNNDVEGKMFFRARTELIDSLIKSLDPQYKKDEECT